MKESIPWPRVGGGFAGAVGAGEGGAQGRKGAVGVAGRRVWEQRASRGAGIWLQSGMDIKHKLAPVLQESPPAAAAFRQLSYCDSTARKPCECRGG